jgi:ppGpp synthetase/RelA/SpoT-type nucleotidyltranferase
MNPELARQWYSQTKSNYSSLADVVRTTLDGLLKNSSVDYLNVTSRVKSLESFAEKFERKGYADPEKEMTDLAGIRVITYIERDVDRVCQIIQQTFNVHKDKSLDKASELEENQFGYRSVHFVCDLGSVRGKLPEFAVYSGLFFEVQVRTVLQHAWAEIEHDRNYKLAGVLPRILRRRLFSIAGTLEMADREFNAIASELDDYAKSIAATAKKGELDVEIDSTTLSEYLKGKMEHYGTTLQLKSRLLPVGIQELRDYGLTTLADVDAIMPESFWKYLLKYTTSQTVIGLLRKAMMFNDLDRYFERAWKSHFQGMAPETFKLLCKKYGNDKVEKVLKECKIHLP